MRWMMMLVVAVMLLGCAQAPFAARSSHFQLQVQIDTNGIGKRPLTLTLSDAQNNPVSDAQITVSPVMPQHGMLAVPLAMQHTNAGVYQIDALDLTMTGEWQLQFVILRNGERDELMLPVTIK